MDKKLYEHHDRTAFAGKGSTVEQCDPRLWTQLLKTEQFAESAWREVLWQSHMEESRWTGRHLDNIMKTENNSKIQMDRGVSE